MSLPRLTRSPPTPSNHPHAIPQAIPLMRQDGQLSHSPHGDNLGDVPSPSPSSQPIYQPAMPTSTLEEPSQSFLPIFTLIEDAATQQHFHPKVHYIFSDDVDTPLDAFLSDPPGQTYNDEGAMIRERTDVIDATRAIVLGLSQDLSKVVAAHSLSSEWQVTGVNMGRAPQWLVGEDGAQGSVSERGGGGGGESDGLMLTIEGTSIQASEAGRKHTGGQEGIYELANMFADRMAVIKRVIDFDHMQDAEERKEQERLISEYRARLEIEQRILEQEEQRHLEQEGLQENVEG